MNSEHKKALDFCLKRIDQGLIEFNGGYPNDASEDGKYPLAYNDNGGWTQGFWTGMIWMAYELTGDKKYLDTAMYQVKDFHHRIENKIGVNHHDMGFLYLPSCVAAYRLTGDTLAKEAALLAADNLCSRFHEKGQFIQAWGNLGDENDYRLIIDCLLNIPLLFWAYDETGNEEYKRIALAHLNTSADVLIREDGTTYHTFFFDPKTGEPVKGVTAQGYSDSSMWARGQAWGVYGFATAYKYTKDPQILQKFNRVTKVFIEHLPDDDIPAWDMIFTDTETQKDSSAAAIAICGILEMSRQCDEIPTEFLEAAEKMMAALEKDYLTDDIPHCNGILKHAVYSMPANLGVDECNLWGDYYFMEALMRYTNPNWKSYWE